MKKCSFYTCLYIDGVKTAVLQHGYSDGTFYYYSKEDWRGKTWYAVHPLVGLSVVYGHTRKDAAEHAHAPGMMESIRKHMEQYGERLTKEFETAITIAKLKSITITL